MESKVNYVIVGLFVLLLSAALIAGVLWLSAGKQYRNVYDTYVAYMHESVSGLNQNASVKYRGVNVGQVRLISLDKSNPELVRLELKIERGTPITEDTVAVLKAQGLTGIAYVDLSGGSKNSPLLKTTTSPPYPEIKTKLSLLGRLDVSLTSLLINFNKTAESMNAMMDEENQRALKQTLSHVASLTGTLVARKAELDKVVTNASLTMENVANISMQMQTVIDRVARSAEAVEKVAKDATRTSTSVRKSIETIGPDAQRFTGEGLPELERLIVELRELSVAMQRVTQQVEQDPSILLRGKEVRPRGPGE